MNVALPALRYDTVVQRLEAATALLADADIALAKELKAVGKAAEEYVRSKHLGEEIEQRARGVTLKSERKLGELLAATPKNEGQIRRGSELEPRDDAPTLADLGVDKKESMSAQQLATLSEDKFNEVLEGKTTVRKALSDARGGKPKPPKPPKPKNTDVAKLQAQVEELTARCEHQQEALDALVDTDKTLEAFKDNEQVKEMQILRLELKSCKRRRDELMAENASLKKQVAYLQKKLDKK